MRWKKILRQIQAYRKARKLTIIPDNPWVCVYRSMDVYSVLIRQMKLEEEGVKVRVFNQLDSSYNNFGDAGLEVLRSEKTKAMNILETLNA